MKNFAFITVSLFLVLQLAARAQECDRAAVAVATTSIPQQSVRGLKQHLEKLESLNRSSDFIVVGDSLGANFPNDLATREFGAKRPYNFAVGGSRTQNLLWDLSEPRVKSLHPSKVLLSIGTNNIGAGDAVCGVVAGITTVIAKISDIWPNAQIEVMQIPYRGQNFQLYRTEIDGVNSFIAGLGKFYKNVSPLTYSKEKVACDSNHNSLKDIPQSMLEMFPTVKTQCAFYNNDNLHLNKSGYIKMFEKL